LGYPEQGNASKAPEDNPRRAAVAKKDGCWPNGLYGGTLIRAPGVVLFLVPFCLTRLVNDFWLTALSLKGHRNLAEDTGK
jgi:hypothetical protein